VEFLEKQKTANVLNCEDDKINTEMKKNGEDYVKMG
jgi:hypothetical protein